VDIAVNAAQALANANQIGVLITEVAANTAKITAICACLIAGEIACETCSE